MSQFTPATASRLHLLALLFVVVVFANNNHVAAGRINGKSDYDYHQLAVNEYPIEDGEIPYEINPDRLSLLKNHASDSGELLPRDVWSRVFRSGYMKSPVGLRSNHLPMASSIGLRDGEVRLIPYSKRMIPIELQKALYAHGIVGRRR